MGAASLSTGMHTHAAAYQADGSHSVVRTGSCAYQTRHAWPQLPVVSATPVTGPLHETGPVRPGRAADRQGLKTRVPQDASSMPALAPCTLLCSTTLYARDLEALHVAKPQRSLCSLSRPDSTHSEERRWVRIHISASISCIQHYKGTAGPTCTLFGCSTALLARPASQAVHHAMHAMQATQPPAPPTQPAHHAAPQRLQPPPLPPHAASSVSPHVPQPAARPSSCTTCTRRIIPHAPTPARPAQPSLQPCCCWAPHHHQSPWP